MRIVNHEWTQRNGAWDLFLQVDKEDFRKRVYTPHAFPRIFKRKDCPDGAILVRSEEGIFVTFHAVQMDPKRGGYGGSVFKFYIDDGTVLENVGAWSSRASVINHYFPEEAECTEVVYNDRPGGGGIAGAATIQGLMEYFESKDEYVPIYRCVDSDGEIRFFFREMPKAGSLWADRYANTMQVN